MEWNDGEDAHVSNIVYFLIYNLLTSAGIVIYLSWYLSCKVIYSSLSIRACMRDHDVDCVAVSWSWLRIPGVLQRLGFTYFVLSLLQTFWGHEEIPLRAVSSSVRFTLVFHYTPGDKKSPVWNKTFINS